MFEVPSGGRRYRALEVLVKKKRRAHPLHVRTAGDAVEDSLAENVQRAPLHPLDQFRAFLALREKGQSEEEIAPPSPSCSMSCASGRVWPRYRSRS